MALSVGDSTRILFDLLASSSGLARVVAGTLTATETAALAVLSGSAVTVQKQQVQLLKQTGLARFVGLTTATTLGELVLQVGYVSATNHLTKTVAIAAQVGTEDTPIESLALDLSAYVGREVYFMLRLDGTVDHIWTPTITSSATSGGSYDTATCTPAVAAFANDTGSTQFVRHVVDAAAPFLKVAFVADTDATGWVAADYFVVV